MRRISAFVILAFLFFMTGCAGMKSTAFVKNPENYSYYSADTKIPARLAIVDTNSLKSSRYINKNGTKTVEFYPGLLEIAKSSLDSNFKYVEIVSPNGTNENFDLYAYIKSDIARISKFNERRNEIGGMKVAIDVDFRNANNKSIFLSKKEFQFYLDEVDLPVAALNVMVLATAGIGAPAAVQLAGDKFAEHASLKVANSFDGVSRQIDSNLNSFMLVGPSQAVASTSPAYITSKDDRLSIERKRLETERQKVEADKQKIASDAIEDQRLESERQRIKNEKAKVEAEKKQLAAKAERQRLEEEKAQLEQQKAELAELRKKPKQAFSRPKAEATKERRTALVIGNSAYQRGPLKNPANDARDMAAALKHLGFDVTTLTDATQSQMENAVRDFGTKLRQGGVGLFYYAGHGVQVSGENFLVPVNAIIQSEGDVKYGSVNAGLVLAKMEDAGNGLNIVILDACRSNPYARSFRTASEGLAKMDAPTGSLIAYATAPGSVASDGTGRNGVFTRHLLENMKEPGLPISEVLMRVRQGVVKETAKKQVPWEASSLIGQFYFSE